MIAAVGRRQDLHAQYALIGLVMDVANDALQGACRRLDRDQFACWNSLIQFDSQTARRYVPRHARRIDQVRGFPTPKNLNAKVD